MWRLHGDQARLIDPKKIMAITGRHYFEEMLKDHALILVAAGQDHIVGLLTASVRKLPAYYRADRELYLDDLIVARDHRGQGIAGRLVEAAEKHAREQNIPLLSGKIWAFNGESRSVFTKQGFEADYELWHKQVG
jgi:GNAT superfamily N-acetyltransferase